MQQVCAVRPGCKFFTYVGTLSPGLSDREELCLLKDGDDHKKDMMPFPLLRAQDLPLRPLATMVGGLLCFCMYIVCVSSIRY